jgi:hypothetical protein
VFKSHKDLNKQGDFDEKNDTDGGGGFRVAEVYVAQCRENGAISAAGILIIPPAIS